MSDIHGHLAEFDAALALVDLSKPDTVLMLLGDYIHEGPDSFGVLFRIIDLQRKYGSGKVVALMGNHEKMAINGDWAISRYVPDSLKLRYSEEFCLDFLRALPLYHTDGNVVFVHAGVNEASGKAWQTESGEDDFLWAYPAKTGVSPTGMTIVAGHVHTSEIAGSEYFNDIFFDGSSHYYIDGDTARSGAIPVLKADTDTHTFKCMTAGGETDILPML